MISISRDRDTIVISGHANYGPIGYDIVCEAVTAQVQTLAASLEAIAEVPVKMETKAGYARVEALESNHDTKILIDAFMLGMQILENAYPKHVWIKTEE